LVRKGGTLLVEILKDVGKNINREIKELPLKFFFDFVNCFGDKS